MKKLSVSELAKLYGYSRQAIYAHINKEIYLKDPDGLIDFRSLRVLEHKKRIQSIEVNQLTVKT